MNSPYPITNITVRLFLTVTLEVKLKGGCCKYCCNSFMKISIFIIRFLLLECKYTVSEYSIFLKKGVFAGDKETFLA